MPGYYINNKVATNCAANCLACTDGTAGTCSSWKCGGYVDGSTY